VPSRSFRTSAGTVGRMDVDPAWLEPTYFIDSDHPAVVEFAEKAVGDATDQTEIAVHLFHAVRDGLRYDPYNASRERDSFKASSVATATSSWCVPKSVLLTAAARQQGIASRLGFADVKNHLTSAKLRDSMQTDVFMWHGYSELLLDGRWFKLSSAFNTELCEKFGTKVLEFDGTADALMHPFDAAGNRHMEYVNQRGSFDDLPLDQIHATFDEFYGRPDGIGVSASSAAEAGDDAFS